jgi:CheY-like chemotaxis protein
VSTSSTLNGADSAVNPAGHVLIVDDEAGIRDFLHAILQAEGYSVAVATDGREALDRVAERPPDVVLLDLAMPVMNGWQFQERLRELGLHLPLIFMSAGYDAEEQARLHHAEGHLSKPFEVEDMLRAVGRYAGIP